MTAASLLDRARDIGETYAECAHDEPAAHPLTTEGVRAFLDAETCTGLGLVHADVTDAPAAWFADVLASAQDTLCEIDDAREVCAEEMLLDTITDVGDGNAHLLASAFAAYCRTFVAPEDDVPADVLAAYQRAARALDEAAAALREVAG